MHAFISLLGVKSLCTVGSFEATAASASAAEFPTDSAQITGGSQLEMRPNSSQMVPGASLSLHAERIKQRRLPATRQYLEPDPTQQQVKLNVKVV